MHKAELAHIPQSLWCDLLQILEASPRGAMHLPQIGPDDGTLIRSHSIPNIVMPMPGLVSVGPGRDAVTVDVDGNAGRAMPWMERKALQTGFLQSLAQSRSCQILRGLVMASGLEPASEGPVMDQKDPSPLAIENESRCRDMPGNGATGMNVVSARDLASQEGMPFMRHAEGSGMIVQDGPDMMPESCWIETRR